MPYNDNIHTAITHPSAIYGLPVEILTHIFALIQTPVRLSHICRWFRHIILTSGILWARISISRPRHFRALLPYLERSRDVLLQVTINYGPAWRSRSPFPQSESDVLGILGILSPHFHRIESFKLSYSDGHEYWRTPRDVAIPPIPDIIAVNLKYLDINMQVPADSPLFNLSLHCPNLKKANLEGLKNDKFGLYTAQSISLQELSLPSGYVRPSKIAADIIPVLRANSHSLVTLAVKHPLLLPPTPQLVIMDSLEHVRILSNAALRVFDCITAPRLKTLQLDFEHGDAPVLDSVIPSLEVVRIDNPGGSWHKVLPFIRPSFHSLRQLELQFVLFDPPDNIVPWTDPAIRIQVPLLETLSIGGLIDGSFLWCITEAPNLKELKIDNYYNSEPCDVDLGDHESLFLPALRQLDTYYLPHTFRKLAAPNLNILHLWLHKNRSFQATQGISTFLRRCGPMLEKLYVDGLVPFCHPPMAPLTAELISLSNLRILRQVTEACIAPSLNITMGESSIEHLILYPSDENQDTFSGFSRYPVMPYLIGIRTLTIFHIDDLTPGFLWAFTKLNTLQIQMEPILIQHPDMKQPMINTDENYVIGPWCQSLFADVLGSNDSETGSLPCPGLQHLHLRFESTSTPFPIRAVKQ